MEDRMLEKIYNMQEHISDKMDERFDETDASIGTIAAGLHDCQRFMTAISEKQSAQEHRLQDQEQKTQKLYKSIFEEGGLLGRVEVINAKNIAIVSGISTVLTVVVTTVVKGLLGSP